jgi:TatD DNase family protein
LLIDSHAHLNSQKFQDDFAEILQRAKEYDVARIVNIGYNLDSSRKSVDLAVQYDEISAAVGFHPHDASEVQESDWADMEKIAMHSEVVAVGEMGLDYYRNLSPKDVQKDVFRRQMRLARRIGKPIIIHDRDAHLDVLTMLKEENAGENGGVMHCFSGSKETAKECMDLGFYISIAGPVTFTNAPRLQDVARYIPLDRLMIETDCPYLAPVPHRGKRNEPAFVRYVAEKIAEIRGIDYMKIAEATSENTKRLFRL